MTKPIKILFLTTGLNTGGAEMMLCKLLSRLDRKVFSPVVLSLKPGILMKRIEGFDIPVYVLQLKKFHSWKNIIKTLRQIRPDIIQGWMYHGNLFSYFLKSLFFPRSVLLFGIRHTPSSDKKNKILTRAVISLGAFFSKYTKGIIYASHQSNSYHKTIGYNSSQSITIPNGFDLELFQPGAERRKTLRKLLFLEEEAFIIGCAARYHPIKGYDVFLEAAEILKKKGYEQVHFVCLGHNVDWNNSFFLIEEKKLDLSRDYLHLLGEKENIQNFIAGFDLFTLSSYSEGFPNVLGEAMSCAVPCVATNAGDSSFIIGETGRVVPPGNPTELAKAWEYFIQMPPEKRITIGTQARKRIEDNFTIDNVVKKYQDTYKKLI